MKQLPFSAKIYILVILITGGAMAAWQLSNLAGAEFWLLLFICALASALQSIKFEGSTYRTSYNLSWVVYGFTLFVLGPPETMLVILVAHLVEWAWHRYAWYIQFFNMATFSIAVTAAGLAYTWISPSETPLSFSGSLAILTAAALFTFVNHLLVGMVVKLARGQSLAESGVLGPLTLAIDFGMLCLGAAGALIWEVNPYAVILIALLSILLQNVLKVPALQRQSETDPKVGLFNARYFAKTLEQELDRANRFDRPLTLVMSDLDLLRRVNNDYGHLAGDAVLRGVAQILAEKAREYDIVARFGGEEFAILMPETTPDEALALVEAMRQAIEEAAFAVDTSATPIQATMSFGIAGRLEGNLSAEKLIHQADLGAYQAKQAGRNCCRIYGQEATTSLPASPSESLAEAGSGAEGPVADLVPAKIKSEAEKEPAARPGFETAGLKTSEPAPAAEPDQPWFVRLYVGAVAVIALSLISLLIQPVTDQDWLGLAAFTVVVLLFEAMAVNIYVKETSVSTSVAPLLAGVLLFGPAAAIIFGLAVAMAAFVRQRSQPDRLIFNSSNHVIGGLLAAGLVIFSGHPFRAWSMPAQTAISLIAISLIYLSTTLLVAGAVSISHRRPLKAIWNERFRWLAPYYLALGVVAFALVFSYQAAGLLGIVVILVPLAMLRYSQKLYIDHTKTVVDKLRATNLQLTRQAAEISLLNEELLVALAKATDMRDPYVMEHSLNVSRYAKLIATELNLPAERVEMVRKAGLLHDIGKLSIPDAILFKPGKLTSEEYAVIQAHTVTGARLIEDCHSLRPLLPIIRHHHEHYDGNGYPDGVAGETIPLEARILGVADALEAMASDRPYRKGRTAQAILDEMNRCAGTQFDPQVVNALARVVQKQGDSVVVNSARYVQFRKTRVARPAPAVAKSDPRPQENLGRRPALASG